MDVEEIVMPPPPSSSSLIAFFGDEKKERASEREKRICECTRRHMIYGGEKRIEPKRGNIQNDVLHNMSPQSVTTFSPCGPRSKRPSENTSEAVFPIGEWP